MLSSIVGFNPLDKGQEDQTFSRLEGASRKGVALARSQSEGQRIGLVIGMSTAEYGVDLRTLDQIDSGLKWAKVIGEHASFSNMLAIVRRVVEQGVKPERVLLCFHYGMFVGAERAPVSRSYLLSRVLSRADDLNVFGEISRAWGLTWIGRNRMPVVNVFETQLGALRERSLTAFSQDAPAIYAPIDPFVDTKNTRTSRGPAAWAGRIALVKERGWQNEAAYAVGNEQVRALQEVLPLLRANVVLVLLPERSVLRELIPETRARAVLDQAIAEAKLPSPPILDLRAALPDEEFVDEAHPTGAGRRHLSAVLKGELPTLFSLAPQSDK